MDLTARVLAATERAFADSVVHAVDDRETGPDSETWYDETTSAGRTRDLTPEGAPIVDFGRVTPPAPGDRAPELPPFDSPETCVPGPCMPEDLSDHPVEQVRTVCYDVRRYGQGEAPMVTPVSEAERIRQMVEADMLVEDGTEVVDERELIRLRAVPTDALPDRGAYLVDPETYRPVMYRGEPSELTDQDGQVHRFSGSVTRFEYLPRTTENLALLSPPVPDGFTEVSSEELQHIDCG